MKIGLLSVACSLGSLALRAASPEPLSTPAKDLRSDTWPATDALGRALPGFVECGPRKGNRVVGMFYFVTHNNNGAKQGPFDVTKILAADPEHPKWGGGTHYWGEPEAGYYIMKDEWIVRRHARQLCDAGVALIVLDTTNDHFYEAVVGFIADGCRRMGADGEPTPQIACLASQISVELLWDKIYSRGLYADLWFRWKGKPLLLFGQHVTGNRQQVNDVRYPKAITDFFTIRQSRAWTTLRRYDDGHDEWPWVDHYPQSVGWSESPDRAEYVPVAVAEHPLSNIGRSFHDGVQPESDRYVVTPDTDKGLYFAVQGCRALDVDPEFVFGTGWNEWSAGQMTRRHEDYDEEMRQWDFFPGANCGKGGRKIEMGESYFIDQYNQEYSRDIEPMKGGHGDYYYYQLMAAVRRYKGVAEPDAAGPERTIDLNGGFDQWKRLECTYFDHVGDTYHRDSPGNFAAGPYVNRTGRNDIVESKVARDDRFVYFYVRTAEPLTPYTDPLWMLLFIDADGDHSTGWEGYDLLVNESLRDDRRTSVRAYGRDDWGKPATIDFRYEGNEMMVAVPRKFFGSGKLSFDFHWADGIQKLGDIDEFLLNGDQAPSRRANYHFEE